MTDGEDEESEQERRAREKEERKKARDAERELRDASIQAAPDIKESGGFSLSLASVDRFGRVTQVDSYYGGVTLQVILRGVDPIAEFFVFRVAACNGEGQGPWSAWSDSFATLQPAQPAPTAPRATQRRTNARGKSLFPGAARD